MERFATRWPAVERAALTAVGVTATVVGIVWLVIAIDPRPESKIAADFRPFAAVVGLTTVVAGALAAARRREDLVLTEPAFSS
jgi:hypothetical protein